MSSTRGQPTSVAWNRRGRVEQVTGSANPLGKENQPRGGECKPSVDVEGHTASGVRRRPLQDAGNVPRPGAQRVAIKPGETSNLVERKLSVLRPTTGNSGGASPERVSGECLTPPPVSFGTDDLVEVPLPGENATWSEEGESHTSLKLWFAAPLALDISDAQVPEPEIVPKGSPTAGAVPLFYEPLVSFAEQDMGMGVSQEQRLLYQDLDAHSPGAPLRLATPPLPSLELVGFAEEESRALPRAVYPSPRSRARRLAALAVPTPRLRRRQIQRRDFPRQPGTSESHEDVDC
ncbi:hypothetical protein CCYA_CCYA04G1417 [Cyanidiococcus yangmingshanensis]|nr:hypothetical protein CCYA_CCYA04G1417 [Cyanidiococcus yangmingshanensis]